MGPEALHELGEEKELSSLKGGRSTRSNFGPAHSSLTLILIKILGLNKLFINVLLIFCLEEKRKQICKVIANNSSQSCQIISLCFFSILNLKLFQCLVSEALPEVRMKPGEVDLNYFDFSCSRGQ